MGDQQRIQVVVLFDLFVIDMRMRLRGNDYSNDHDVDVWTSFWTDGNITDGSIDLPRPCSAYVGSMRAME